MGDIEGGGRRYKGELKQLTIINYDYILSSISKKIWNTDKILISNFIKYDEVEKYLMKLKVVTRQKMLAPICNLLRNHETELKLYRELLSKTMQEFKDTAESQEKNPREVKNWCTMKELIDLKDKLRATLTSNVPSPIDHNYVISMQRYVIFALYTILPPLRCDYASFNVVYAAPPPNDTNNYYDSVNHIFYLRDHKTDKRIGERVIKVDDVINVYDNKIELITALDQWTKLNNTGWFLIKKSMSNDKKSAKIGDLSYSKMSREGLSDLIIYNTKKYLSGRAIGPQIIRKVYLSEKYPVGDGGLSEQKKDAIIMGHTVNTQQNVYRRKN